MTDNTSTSRRRFLQATGGAASAAAIAGCISGGGSGGDRNQQDKEFRKINATMSTLDPVKATDTASGTVIQQVFDGLTNYPNGEIETTSLLADSVETSDDFTEYTFSLKDAQFHNGDEVTAEDFIYSFERLAASSNSRRAYFILDSLGVDHETTTIEVEGEDGTQEQEVYKNGSLALEAVDEKTLRITLSEPFANVNEMLAYSSFSAVPAGMPSDIPGWDQDEPPTPYEFGEDATPDRFSDYQTFSQDDPVGAGPFVFDTWKTNTEARVTRNEDYHGSVPIVSAVHWQILSDPDSIYNYAMNQNADQFGIPTSKYDPSKVSVDETDDLGRKVGTYGELRNGLTADYLGVATINAFYIGMNAVNVEKPARQAMAYAMDQEQVIQDIFKGRGRAAYHFTPPNIYPGGATEYENHAESSYPYGYGENAEQLDQARQVMEDAGYSADNQYEFTFTYYESGSATWGGLGQQLRDKLSSAHIKLNLESAPFSTLLNRGRQGNLEAYSLGWIMDYPSPENFLQNANPELTRTLNTSDSPATGLYVDWEGTDAAQRAQEAWNTITSNPAPTDEDAQARAEAYVEMEEAMWEDMILLPAYHQIDEQFTYDWADVPKFGGGGTSRQKYNEVEIGDRPS